MATTVIVGAGVVGLACAHALLERGEQVIVIDQDVPGNACSRGNAGWIVPSLSNPLAAPGLTAKSLRWLARRDGPLYIAPSALPELAGWLWRFRSHCNARDYEAGTAALVHLNERTIALYEQLRRTLAADGGAALEMHRDGLLFVYLTQAELDAMRRDFELMQRHGLSAPRVLDGNEVRALEPALGDAIVGGLLIEAEAHVRPETLCAALADRAGRLGGEIRPSTTVTGITARGRTVESVTTSSGVVRGDRFVIAAGAWTGTLTGWLDAPLPVQAGKGYSLTFHPPTISIHRPLYLTEAHVGCSPFDGAVRFAGTMELSGINTRFDHERVRGICRNAEQYLREPPTWSQAEAWVGMRPITPDGLPIIGKLPHHDNALVATGHSMLGVTLAPVTAALIADLAIDGKSEIDPAPFDPRRYL